MLTGLSVITYTKQQCTLYRKAGAVSSREIAHAGEGRMSSWKAGNESQGTRKKENGSSSVIGSHWQSWSPFAAEVCTSVLEALIYILKLY